MIRLTNVSKSYARSSKKAVNNLTLEVHGGEIFGFIGPNGAGKSTTIKMITGILAPTEGTVEIDGVNIAQNPSLAKSFIGFVPDNHETYETLKGIEYLNFIGTMYNVESTLLKSRIDEYARIFSLTDALPNMIASYSHGMKQKLMVIAALIHAPKVWILDEPMTGLDPQSAFQLKQLMRKYADEGNTVFFSSHVIDVVEKVCDRIGIINHGELVAVDTLDNIRADKNVSLESIFLTITSDATATVAVSSQPNAETTEQQNPTADSSVGVQIDVSCGNAEENPQTNTDNSEDDK